MILHSALTIGSRGTLDGLEFVKRGRVRLRAVRSKLPFTQQD